MNRRLIIAQDGWGEVPEWVLALVQACNAPGSSQNKVAIQLGVSGSAVSQTMSGKYKGDLIRMEDRIRSVFLNGDVDCPALGQTKAKTCLKYRDQADRLRSSSPMRVQMFKACNACPRYRRQNEGDDAAALATPSDLRPDQAAPEQPFKLVFKSRRTPNAQS